MASNSITTSKMNSRKLTLIALFFAVASLQVGLVTPQDDDEAEGEPGEIEERDGVLVLDANNFDEVVNSKEIILVEFYAPWCGHCKRLAPEYAKAAQTMAAADPPVPFAMVDADAEKDLASQFGVSGYPTLKIFRNGEPSDYSGPRDEIGIVEYMKEQSDPNWTPPPEAVITLTQDNFDDIVTEAELILVEFYAPWCGHCKQLAPELESAAKILQGNNPPVPIAKVDATAESDLATRFDVSGYPTLKIFRKGQEFEFKGPRKSAGIVTYMKKQIGDSSQLLGSVKALREFLTHQEDVSIVGFFNDKRDKLYSTYLNAGNSLRDEYRFAHVFSEEARESYKVNAPSVVVFLPERFRSKYEPWRHVFSKADGSATELESFYAENDVPLVGQMTRENKNTRYADRPLLVAYFSVEWSFDHRVATEIHRQKIVEVAKDKEFDELLFAIADEEEFQQELKELELDDSGEDINVGIWGADKRKFRLDPEEEFDSDVLREFIRQWQNDDLKPVIKSQPVPKKSKAAVKTVVGKTFDQVVLDKSKDVLIEFYAPWCGHCKKLEPVYKKLGKKYEKSQNLVIAKMDATANDISHSAYEVSGFPTIYFSKATDKDNPVKFSGGERSLEKLSEFIEKEATVYKPKREEL
ncbi:protein disulfide-isomerase A4-like [Diadema antillarum]|uniref:protein disulfide-isomerase A4-like n=1 Tax=Diadema antillarum TaxID=105358 RepID=UPI003A889846